MVAEVQHAGATTRSGEAQQEVQQKPNVLDFSGSPPTPPTPELRLSSPPSVGSPHAVSGGGEGEGGQAFLGAAPQTPDQLDGLLVSLDLQGVSLRADGELLRARPQPNRQLDSETADLVRAHKAGLMAWVGMGLAERTRRLVAAFEAVLPTVGREVQELYKIRGRSHPEALAAERGFLVALRRLEQLYGGEGA